jgi:EmrB/QacA subfamily drug resistance transporter
MNSNTSTVHSKWNFKSHSIILIIILVSTFISVLDSNVVSTALPSITRFFHTDIGISQWIITAYLITTTALLLIFGKLAGYLGKEKLFTIGLIIFLLSSLCCGISPNMTVLILSRIIQATGAAMMFSISVAILMQVFPQNDWGRIMGLYTATIAVAMLIGPVIGGLVVDWFGWQYIFFINLPIGTILLAACLKHLKQNEKKEHIYIDLIGSLLFIILIVSLALIMKGLDKFPDIKIQTFLFSGIFIVSLVAFISGESKCKEPLLDLSIFKIPEFTFPLISMILYFSAVFILGVVEPFYYQIVLGYTATQSGMLSFIPTLMMVIGSPISGFLYDKYYNKNYAALGVFVLGLALVAGGYLYKCMHILPIIGSIIIAGAGAALFQSTNNADVMSALPTARKSIVSSIMATSRNLGMAFGTALASILVSYQLDIFNHSNDMVHAGGPLLAEVFGNTMYIAGAMCILSAMFSLQIRDITKKHQRT